MADGRNREAQAANQAAHAAGQHQQADQNGEVARLVAAENESRNRLPRHQGLERWELLQKMGDGAFSNVYRARDTEGRVGRDVAIKVVRKFEMNSNQVSTYEMFH